LEDSFGAAFSGKYKSLFVPNTGTEEERLSCLMNAIAEVYASTFGPDPIEYRRERNLLDYSEEMAVLIQEVVGTHIGHYFMPAFGGVAFSRNEFRWSPRIQREDGVIRLVPGLGTRAVDRVGNDYPVLISPNRPNLQVNQLISEKIKYSPQYLDTINLNTGAIETVDAIELFKEYGEEFPILDQIISIYKDDQLVPPQKFLFNPKEADMVVTFANLFEKTDFLKKMQKILTLLESKLKTPVDIEFASDGKQLYFLQCRPQSQSLDIERKPIPKDILASQKLFSSNKYVTTGQIDNIEYIVYVRHDAYNSLETREDMQKIARIIGDLNMKLPRRKFILLGPGRWGSRGDIKLGVPVQYGDINNTALLVEIAKEKDDYTPELSFGTHFFQDLVEANIKYLPLYPDQPKNIFNEKDLLNSENQLPTLLPTFEEFKDVVHVAKISDIIPGGTFSVIMDGEAGEALGYLKPPDHWKWRMNKTEEIAETLDPEVYAVKALYLIGSTKEGNAGPASDIDLIVHFEGNEEQREKLLAWFQKWSKKLDAENQQRTGLQTGGLLDIHIITDEDIKNNNSWAAHLTSSYSSVRKIPMGKK
ncbi:MAG: PEP/pyruvate-binding domain-containing protein, partial [Thermoplasmatota archaeon]